MNPESCFLIFVSIEYGPLVLLMHFQVCDARIIEEPMINKYYPNSKRFMVGIKKIDTSKSKKLPIKERKKFIPN